MKNQVQSATFMNCILLISPHNGKKHTASVLPTLFWRQMKKTEATNWATMNIKIEAISQHISMSCGRVRNVLRVY